MVRKVTGVEDATRQERSNLLRLIISREESHEHVTNILGPLIPGPGPGPPSEHLSFHVVGIHMEQPLAILQSQD